MKESVPCRDTPTPPPVEILEAAVEAAGQAGDEAGDHAEKTFRVDEFSVVLGRSLNADIKPGNMLRLTSNQLISLGKKVAPKFRRTPTMKFILGAIDTEPQDKEPKEAQGAKGKPRETRVPVATSKTSIVEKSQADGQMTDQLVRSTKQILKRVYRLVRKSCFTLHITVT